MIKSLIGQRERRLEREIQELAIEAINIIEEEMMIEFGLSFKVGIEIEGWAKKPKGSDGKEPPLDECDIYQQFNKRLVNRFYKETAAGLVYFQYEFATQPLAPTAAARVVTKLKDVSTQRASKFGLESFSFAPFNEDIDHDIKTAGMHVNVSLWRGKEPVFAFDSDHCVFSDLMLAACNKEALLFQRDAFFCVAMSDDHFRRLKRENGMSPSFIGTSAGIDEDTLALRGIMDEKCLTRIENKLPGADSDPYLSVLTTVASVFAGVVDGEIVERSSESFKSYFIQLDPEEARFPDGPKRALEILMRSNNRFTALLDEISPGLGKKMVEKIEEYAEVKYGLTLQERGDRGVAR